MHESTNSHANHLEVRKSSNHLTTRKSSERSVNEQGFCLEKPKGTHVFQIYVSFLGIWKAFNREAHKAHMLAN